MQNRASQLEQQHSSLNVVKATDSDDKATELIQQVKDNSIVEFDKFWVKEFIESVVTKSTWKKNRDRNIKIVSLRVFKGLKFDQIAKECNVTKRQVQVVMKSFRENAMNSEIIYQI